MIKAIKSIHIPILILIWYFFVSCSKPNSDIAGSRVGTETTLNSQIKNPDQNNSGLAKVSVRNKNYRPSFILDDPSNMEFNGSSDSNGIVQLSYIQMDTALIEIVNHDSTASAWVWKQWDEPFPDLTILSKAGFIGLTPGYNESSEREIFLGFLGTNHYHQLKSSQKFVYQTIPKGIHTMDVVVKHSAPDSQFISKITNLQVNFDQSDSITIWLDIDGIIREFHQSPKPCYFSLDGSGFLELDSIHQSPLCKTDP